MKQTGKTESAFKMRMRRGYGSIRYIGGGRKNPYAVHTPAKRQVVGGIVRYERCRAICYVPDWLTGFEVLTAWHAGYYHEGLEKEIIQETSGKLPGNQKEFEMYCERIQRYLLAEMPKGQKRVYTLKEVCDRFCEYKYGENAVRRLAESTAVHGRAIARKLEPLYDRTLDELTVDELQNFINGIGLGRTMVSKTLLLIRELYRYALSRDLCSKNPAQYLQMPDTPDYVHHQDFTDAELAVLWENRGDPVIVMVLIMCYSGFRVSAYQSLETNLTEGYFRGGIKTNCGKNRLVPIHEAIRPLVEQLVCENSDSPFTECRDINHFNRRMQKKLERIGIDRDGRHHTPHSCRHTFSRLCESYGVREADRKRMLGHSFGNDITNGTYGHRSLEELRLEIAKIQAPECACISQTKI